MRVLLINQYFPPDTAATAKIGAVVARALARRASVVVLAGRPSYDPAEHHRPYLWRWERLHQWALRRADRVVVLGEDMRERIVAKGIPAERVVVVRDGASIPTAVFGVDHPVAQEVRGDFRFVVLHAGNLGFYGAWETLVRAATLLNGEGVGFVFIGAGAAAARVQALATQVNGRARFLSFRPASEVPYILAAGDLHVVTVRRGLEGVVVPSKLYGILAAGRPVLAVAPEASDVARIVRRYRCGVVADPDRPESVAQAVREAMASPGDLAAMGARARAAARDFEQRAELDRFVRVVEAVRSRGRGRLHGLAEAMRDPKGLGGGVIPPDLPE